MTSHVLHLSDLHLGAAIDDVGRADKGSFGAWAKTGKPKMQSHDGYIVWSLAAALRLAARRAGAVEEQFDLAVITGDISTNATTPERFGFARDFLVGDRAVRPNLGLKADRLFAVPGNHDKMWEATPERYLSGFRDLPAPPPYRRSVTARDGTRFVLFGIDSNSYEEANIAEGRVSEATFGWLASELADVETTEPAEAVRMLLLHHHPADLNRFRRLRFFSAIGGRFTRLAEGERLMDLCDGSIDIIVHGHEHFPVVFRDASRSPLIVSAGTTSEWSGADTHENSFHVITIDGSDVRVSQFTWTGARFRPSDWPVMELPRLRRKVSPAA